ncbi:MAG: hypothetical protein ABI831_25725 [Betaproteobacteria bacterium]
MHCLLTEYPQQTGAPAGSKNRIRLRDFRSRQGQFVHKMQERFDLLAERRIIDVLDELNHQPSGISNDLKYDTAATLH